MGRMPQEKKRQAGSRDGLQEQFEEFRRQARFAIILPAAGSGNKTRIHGGTAGDDGTGKAR